MTRMHTVPAGGGKSLRILLSDQAAQRLDARIQLVLGESGYVLVSPASDTGGDGAGADADVAFVSRDVTASSTKHQVVPTTQRFYNAMLASPRLAWVHTHSAGADRPIFTALRERGIAVSTSSGANARVVAHTALAGILALARRFPQLMQAQRLHQWAPLLGATLPRDLDGQTATVVGWGPIGQTLGRLLLALGLKLIVVRQSPDARVEQAMTVTFGDFHDVLPGTDWLILACPLTPVTRCLVNAPALARLPASAHLINVSRGEVVDEAALIQALQGGSLAGAYLDVFAHEPLPAASPLWDLENVIATPHSAGFSGGNEERVAAMFLDNLAHWIRREPLVHLVG